MSSSDSSSTSGMFYDRESIQKLCGKGPILAVLVVCSAITTLVLTVASLVAYELVMWEFSDNASNAKENLSDS